MTTIARTDWFDEVPDVAPGTPINNAAKQALYDQIDAALAELDDAIAAVDGGGPGGSGTVTHVASALTANRLVVGNGAADVTILGSPGTAVTVLHGNAAGPPVFGPVNLSTDVSGALQAAQEPAHTGDVTNTAGSLALAIGAGKVTNAMLAGSIAASKLVGADLSLAESQVVNLVSDLAAIAAALAAVPSLPITNAQLAGSITASKLIGSDLVLTESQITGLVADLALKAALASPVFTGTPTAPTASVATNTTQLATTAFVQAAVAALVASAPGTLDTLNELAAALGNDPNFATTLATSLGLKAPLASPTFTGTPAAPTAAPGTNTTQLASTAFVTAVQALLATIASPTFTGVPAAPTAAPGTNTTQLATTAFVTAVQALLATIASPTFTGVPAAPTAAAGTNTTQLATTAFVAAVQTLLSPGTSAPTTTGTQTALAIPTGSGDLVIYANNATLLTLQGIAAGLAGQLLTIVSKGAGQIDLAHAHASGTALGKLALYATTGLTSLAAGSGVAVFQYDGVATVWRLVSHNQGAWLARPYAGANFAGSGAMTWTVDSGDVLNDRYWLQGRTLFWELSLTTTTTSGTATTTLILFIPGGFSAVGASLQVGVVRLLDAGSYGLGACYANGTAMSLLRFDQQNFALAVNTPQVVGALAIEVQ